MGKKGNWFGAVKKAFSPESKEKKAQAQETSKSKKKWGFGNKKREDPSSSSVVRAVTEAPPPPQPEELKLVEAENEQSKHAHSVALATAAAAEAAVAAAQAAAEVVRLAIVPRYPGISPEEVAAIKIQTAFRGYLVAYHEAVDREDELVAAAADHEHEVDREDALVAAAAIREDELVADREDELVAEHEAEQHVADEQVGAAYAAEHEATAHEFFAADQEGAAARVGDAKHKGVEGAAVHKSQAALSGKAVVYRPAENHAPASVGATARSFSEGATAEISAVKSTEGAAALGSSVAHKRAVSDKAAAAEQVGAGEHVGAAEHVFQGMDLYFKRHDGQAATCEDFFTSMQDPNDANFQNFLLWYSQAGTPIVKVTSSFCPEANTYSLRFSQEVPPTPGQQVKVPMFIPLAVGLLDSNGKDIPLMSVYHEGLLESLTTNGHPVDTVVLQVKKKEEEFVFPNIFERPIPSILRDYSAPICLDSDLTESDLLFLLAHDSNEFNRWEAGQVLARKLMLNLVADFQQNKSLVLNPEFLHGLKSLLSDSSLDKEFIAKVLTLPGDGEIMDMMEVADPDAVHAVSSFIRKLLASEMKSEFLSTVENNRSTEPYIFDHANISRRALKNISLAYLASLEDPDIVKLFLHEYKSAVNMTEQFAALEAIAQNPGKTRDDVLANFYRKWEHDVLVVNKWFALQAMSNIPGNVENVRNLLKHPAFSMQNSNKVSSVIGGFRRSLVNFHAKDGSGYKFLAEIVVQLDKTNPQVASRTVLAFTSWKRYDKVRQALAKEQLEMLMSTNGLSENVLEIVSKSLAA